MKALKIWFIAAVILMVMIAGCSRTETGGNNNNTPGPTPDPAEDKGREKKEPDKVILTIQYPKPDEEAKRRTYDDRIERFKAQYPHVEIRKNDWHYSDGGLAVLMAANDAPSFYNTWATESKNLVDLGYVADLTPFLENYEHADEFNEALMNVFLHNGKYYAIPDGGYVMSIGLNKKIFRDKGVPLPSMDWTWDELIETAKQVNDPKAGIAGFGVAGQTNAAGWHLTNFIYQAGEETQEIRDGKPAATFNSDKALKALEFYHRMRWDTQVLPQNWALSSPDLGAQWRQGRVAMILHPGALSQAVNDAGWERDDVAVYPLPSMEQGTPNTAITGGNFYVINPQRPLEEQEMAFKFVTFDLFKDSGIEADETGIQARMDEGQIYIPNLMSYYNYDSEYAGKLKQLYANYPEHVWEFDPEFLERYNKHAKAEPPFHAQDYYAVMTDIIQIIFTDKNADLKQLLDDGAAKVQTEFLDKVE